MTDSPVQTCQVCGAGPVEKVLFPVAVHFKGKGFYSTDYGKGGRGASAKDGETPAKSTESSSTDSSSGGEKKASTGDSGTSASSTSD